MPKKPGAKKIAKSKLRRHLHCTVDPVILKAFKKLAKKDYSSDSRAADVALKEFVKTHG